ncbi:MAG TPA: O-antigen ligase family protein [Patescibacteria group bacterium]|nr:O-antigen ligase family protein [Patescibacteria group bacterium]
MNRIGSRSLPKWYAYFDVACAGTAGGLWLVRPQLGFWPLFIGLTPWVVRLLLSGRPSSATAYDLPLVIFLLTALVSIWSAYDQEAAWAKFWLIVGAVLLFYAYANWAVYGDRSGSYEQAWSLAILGGLTAILFIATHDWEAFPAKVPFIITLGRALQAPLPAFSFEYIHPNIIGSILAMMAPFAGATVWMSRNKGRPIELVIAISLLFLILLGLLMTTARGAWIGLIGTTVLAIMWPLSRYLSRDRQRRRLLFVAIPLAFLLFLLLILAAVPGGFERLIAWLPASESGMVRGELYANSLALLNDYPIIGAGLGSFMMLYSTYSLLIQVGFNTSSHNMYFDLIIDQGIVALASLFWMWLLMGEAVWRGLDDKPTRRSRRRRVNDQTSNQTSNQTSDQSSETRTLGGGIPAWHSGSGQGQIRSQNVVLGAAAMSLMVMLLHGLVDDSIYYSRALLIFFLPLAFSVPILKKAAVLSWRQRLYTISAAALIIIVLSAIWWRPLLSTIEANLAAVQQSKTELGVYTWPDWPIQDEVRRQSDLKTTIAGFERALQLNPDNASANRRLGQIELSLAEYEDALAHLEKAYTRSPQDNATRQLLGEAYISNGALEEGAILWRTIENGQKQLPMRQFWYGYIGDDDRQENFTAVINALDNSVLE